MLQEWASELHEHIADQYDEMVAKKDWVLGMNKKICML